MLHPSERQEPVVRASDIQQGWTQYGAFADSNGVEVRSYDDVALLEPMGSEPDGNGAVTTLPAGTTGLPAGTTGTVLMFTTGEPCWLELEYTTSGMIFGVVEASNGYGDTV